MSCWSLPVIGLHFFVLLLSIVLFINVENAQSLEKEAISFYNKYIRVKRQSSSKELLLNLPSYPRLYDDNADFRIPSLKRIKRDKKQIPECENDEQWIPPGLRKKGGVPPGQQKKNNGPCRNKIPPGHRKKQWPPLIDENNKDFVYPHPEFVPNIESITNNNMVVYVENNFPVILLRPEDIRK